MPPEGSTSPLFPDTKECGLESGQKDSRGGGLIWASVQIEQRLNSSLKGGTLKPGLSKLTWSLERSKKCRGKGRLLCDHGSGKYSVLSLLPLKCRIHNVSVLPRTGPDENPCEIAPVLTIQNLFQTPVIWAGWTCSGAAGRCADMGFLQQVHHQRAFLQDPWPSFPWAYCISTLSVGSTHILRVYLLDFSLGE